MSKGEQLVEHNLRRSVALDVDFDVHTDAVGVIFNVGNALEPLVLDQIGDIFNQPCFVDLIGQLGDDDFISAVLCLHNLRFGADGNFAAAGRIGGADAASSHDDTAGRKVGTGQTFHQLGKLRVGIVNQRANRVDGFAEVVRRNFRRHADRNTAGAVDQQIGKTAGQHHRLLQTVIVVGNKIDRVLVDVGEHIHRDFAHARLGISVRRRRIAVDRTEVAVTVHQHVTHGEVLRQTHHGVVNRSVAVRMVSTQHRTDGVGALMIGLGRLQASFVHGIENTSVNGLQTVAHIGQRTRHNDAHRIIEEAFAHLILQIDVYYSLFIQLFFHFYPSVFTFYSIRCSIKKLKSFLYCR